MRDRTTWFDWRYTGDLVDVTDQSCRLQKVKILTVQEKLGD